MDLSVKTKPGYTVFSESFIAVFIAGNRKELEERRNWHDLMMHLANAFEKRPRDRMDLFRLLQAAINRISISIPDVRSVDILISNEKFYENPGDKSKAVVHIHLIEDFTRKQSTLNFEIKKSQK